VTHDEIIMTADDKHLPQKVLREILLDSRREIEVHSPAAECVDEGGIWDNGQFT
jgi:hypothetical protein